MRKHQFDPLTNTCTHCLGTVEFFESLPVFAPCRDKHETHALGQIWATARVEGYDAGYEAGDGDGFRDGKLLPHEHLEYARAIPDSAMGEYGTIRIPTRRQ